MKDFSLSSLSRGCGRVITGNASEHGRLDVCFTPQDYYIWKSHDALLHLTNSGSLLRSEESTIPKTYSTRRGPLVLYSRDLVTLGTGSQVSDRRRRVTPQYMQEVDHRSDALLLQQQNNQLTWRFATPTLPPLPNIHGASVSRLYATHERHDPKLHGDPQETTSLLEYPPEDENEIQGSDQRVRLDLVLDLQTCTDHITLEEPQLQVDVSHADRSQQNKKTDLTLVLNLQDAAAVTRGSVMMVNSQNSVTWMNNRRENQSHEEQELNTSSGLLLPPLRAEPPVTPQSYYHHPLAVGREGPNIEEVHHIQHLPPLEDHHVTMRLAGGTQTQQGIQAELRCQKDSRQRPLFLPLLLSDKTHEQIKYKKKATGRDTTGKQIYEEILQHGQQSKKSSEVLLGLVDGTPPPPVGVLGCIAGCRGPGRQSSSAFLQNRLSDLEHSCDSSETKRNVVRGVLPLELRDLKNGQAVGCMIIGPDGEIIRLSLYENYQLFGDDKYTEQEAFQVLSADGKTLPCVMVLQHEHLHSEDRELNLNPSSGNVQYCAPIQTPLDLHKSAECDIRPDNSHVNLVVTTNEITKRAEPMQETQWEDKQDVKNKVVKSSPREQLEELAGGSTEEKDEKQFEHLPKATAGLIDQFDNDMINTLESGLGTTFIQQCTVTGKTPVEKAPVGLKKDTESNNAEEATREKGVKAVKFQERMQSRKNKAGNVSKQKKEEGDARLTKHHMDNKRTKKNATETRKHSSLTSEFHKNKRGIKERQNGKTRTKEAAKEEKGRKEELTQRTRQMKLNHKEDDPNVPSHKGLDDCLEKKEMAAEQETGEGFSLESPRCFAEKPNAVASMEDDNVCLSTDDEHSTESSVYSGSSQMSPSASLDLDARSSLKSSYEGLSADMQILTSSHAQSSSSCSTIMVTEEQLMLELVKTETSRSNEEKTRRQAERAEIRRQEMEKRRKEQEEVERMEQQERKRTKDNIRNELEEERRRRAEHLRLRKLAEEEVRRKREQEEQERARREQAERERARRRQEERRRQMERLQKMREEEARKRNAEVEHLRLEEQRRQEKGCKILQDMDESEKDEYFALQEMEKEDRRTKEEAHRMGEEEQALRAEESSVQENLLSTQMTLLQQQMAFKRGLLLEVEGMGRTQGISRPWVYSYFTLLRLQDLNSTKT